MAANLPPALRDEVTERAYDLSLHGLSAPAISRELSARYSRGISERSIDRYLTQRRLQMREARDAQGMHDLERFLGEQEAVMAKGWELLDEPGISATAKAHIMQDVLAASVNKAKALGIFTERVQHSGDADHPILITLEAARNAPALPGVRPSNIVDMHAG